MTDPTPSTPVTIRDQMQMLSEGLRGSTDATLASIVTRLNVVDQNISDLRDQITLLQEAVGAAPYQALTLTTMRGLLNAILGRMTALAYGEAPASGIDEVSSGETIFDGRRYALFPNPIDGVTISANNRELTRSSWLGWTYYIQTRDPSPWANGVPTVPNIWAPFNIFTTWDFSVDAQYQITVYLQRGTVNANCRVFSTQVREGSHRFVYTFEGPFASGGYDWALSDAATFFEGWQITLISGSGPVLIANGGNPMSTPADSIMIDVGETVTLTGWGGSVLWSWCPGPSTAEFCPPATP